MAGPAGASPEKEIDERLLKVLSRAQLRLCKNILHDLYELLEIDLFAWVKVKLL